LNEDKSFEVSNTVQTLVNDKIAGSMRICVFGKKPAENKQNNVFYCLCVTLQT
jgi:hypothetical protein